MFQDWLPVNPVKNTIGEYHCTNSNLYEFKCDKVSIPGEKSGSEQLIAIEPWWPCDCAVQPFLSVWQKTNIIFWLHAYVSPSQALAGSDLMKILATI